METENSDFLYISEKFWHMHVNRYNILQLNAKYFIINKGA